MITIVEGVVGGGKTIFAVRETIERVAAGGHVYTNVDMVPSEVRQYVMRKYGRFIRSDQIRQLPETESVKGWVDFIGFGTLSDPILVILDEAQMFWNSRDWAKTSKEENPMLSFLTQSRKAGVDVMVISQDAGNIDKQFRVLAQSVVKARNMAHIGDPVFGLKLRGLIRYEWTELATRKVFRSEWWRIDKGLFRCYKTDAFLDSFMQDLAETKERLEKLSLREVSRARRTRDSLRSGDTLERWFGRLILPLLVFFSKRSKRKRQRKRLTLCKP